MKWSCHVYAEVIPHPAGAFCGKVHMKGSCLISEMVMSHICMKESEAGGFCGVAHIMMMSHLVHTKARTCRLAT